MGRLRSVVARVCLSEACLVRSKRGARSWAAEASVWVAGAAGFLRFPEYSVKYHEEPFRGGPFLSDPQVGRTSHSIEKWTGWDLNPRPLPCQDSDLPADLPARDALY